MHIHELVRRLIDKGVEDRPCLGVLLLASLQYADKKHLSDLRSNWLKGRKPLEYGPLGASSCDIYGVFLNIINATGSRVNYMDHSR